jgi:AbrB family looped-hinge helix DNA binding protein
MIITKVGRRGQIVLPRPVRQWLKVDQGDRVVFIRRGNEIILQPLTQTLLDLRGSIAVDGPQDFNAIRRQVFNERGQSHER